MRSDTLSAHFRSNPDEFARYHECREANLAAMVEKPHDVVVRQLSSLKTKKEKVVVDMGCGLAKLASHFMGDPRFKFINYDHVSVAENVEVCDISSMPLEDDCVDVCVMCLSLWGSNCADYVREAHRVLETCGWLYVVDTISRWSDKNENNYIEEGMEGRKLKTLLENSGFKVVGEQFGRFCFFQCVKL